MLTLYHSLCREWLHSTNLSYMSSFPSKLYFQCIFLRKNFPIKSTRAPIPYIPWDSQCSSLLLKYLMQSLWAPMGPVLTLRLLKTHSMTFLSSMFPIMCIDCYQDKRLPQWKSSCYFTISSGTCQHCSHYHPFTLLFIQPNTYAKLVHHALGCTWSYYLICKLI